LDIEYTMSDDNWNKCILSQDDPLEVLWCSAYSREAVSYTIITDNIYNGFQQGWLLTKAVNVNLQRLEDGNKDNEANFQAAYSQMARLM